MTSRLINLRDLQFVLYELLQVGALTERPRYADHSRETFDAAICACTLRVLPWPTPRSTSR
jgi:hypothetical protein